MDAQLSLALSPRLTRRDFKSLKGPASRVQPELPYPYDSRVCGTQPASCTRLSFCVRQHARWSTIAYIPPWSSRWSAHYLEISSLRPMLCQVCSKPNFPGRNTSSRSFVQATCGTNSGGVPLKLPPGSIDTLTFRGEFSQPDPRLSASVTTSRRSAVLVVTT